MDRGVGTAARLPESDRRDLAVQALARSATISDQRSAFRHGVCRKFGYQCLFCRRQALNSSMRRRQGAVRGDEPTDDALRAGEDG